MIAARLGLQSVSVLRQTPRVVRSHVIKRAVQTESIPAASSGHILRKQALARPSSPHFTIYEPQLTWLASIANRATGVGLSVLFYGFSLAYLVAPSTFSSENVVSTVKSLPSSVKIAGKAILAGPFTFHSFNGVRHLLWDLGYFITVKGCYQSGYAVLGLTALGTAGLVAW
ncbi:cytochrome b560 subunit of succinate dehydrogenase [Cylindrobasidium torrendii FP15055 ss-10]|uniref:Cytochrome b560 subunit of succinate dehydrogenase n=1 Tax=Cylindrobasidium torrendii FP15055 ss-10 TaxID=1314674 RepID=A0A0D7BR82_9AGAR|nr:cytochrome b560 subunit of succinate dehydrogenase [Cylindrobasidium torrendii FP15055 ss-10]